MQIVVLPDKKLSPFLHAMETIQTPPLGGDGLPQVTLSNKVKWCKSDATAKLQTEMISHNSHTHNATFDPDPRNEFKNFSKLGGVHSTTFDPELRNERFTLISFMGLPTILSALQPFQICFFNRKYSKLMCSNGPQLMGKRFKANLHASLDGTCKSRISKNFHQMLDPGGSIPQLFDPDPRTELKNFNNHGGSISKLLILN